MTSEVHPMNESPCQYLDDYILDELDDATCRRFESHLSQCSTCRVAIDLQQTIDAALVRCNLQIELPPSLVDTTERHVRRSTRRQMIGVASVAALFVMTCVIAVGSRMVWPDGSSPVTHQTGPMGQTKTAAVEPKRRVFEEERLVEVSFPANQDIIAAEFETDDPTVTVVMVYPTIRPSSVQD